MAVNHCSQCGLPVPARPLRARVRGEECVFCCYGCYLVLRVTGVKGEGGAAQRLMLRLGFGLFFSLNVMVFSLARYGEYFALPHTLVGTEADTARFNLLLEYILLGFASPVMLLIGVPLLRRFVEELRRLSFSIDSLIGVATFAAFGLSVHTTLTGGGAVFYDTATWLLVLVTLGRYLEARAKSRTTDAIEQLLDLAPLTTRRRGDDGTWNEVQAGDLRVGDTIEVRPGEGIPADGVCLDGEGHVDQAALSGEAEPVAIVRGSEVRAGTVSIDAAFAMRVDAHGEGRVDAHGARAYLAAADNRHRFGLSAQGRLIDMALAIQTHAIRRDALTWPNLDRIPHAQVTRLDLVPCSVVTAAARGEGRKIEELFYGVRGARLGPCLQVAAEGDEHQKPGRGVVEHRAASGESRVHRQAECREGGDADQGVDRKGQTP